MKEIQFIGDKPTVKCHQTGTRTKYKDFQSLTDAIIKAGNVDQYKGLELLPPFYLSRLNAGIQPEHIVQLTEGGLS
jgi:hypothetical protein